MSAAPSPAPVGDTAMETATNPRKSYRRKYRKIMVTFEDRMRESTSLFKDEQRIFDISQRLAEQTDQILEMLLELNNTPQVPRRIRYDLKPSSATQPVTTLAQYEDEQTAHEALRLARDRVQKGDIRLQDYDEMQHALLSSSQFAPIKSYANLLKSIRLPLKPSGVNSDMISSPATGTMTIRQEEQYLQSLDEFLAGKNTTPRAHAANSLGTRNAERTADREREMQLRNPVSVYNWLRKHQPQVFLQDHEASGDKSSKAPGARSSKRNTAGKEAKQENDLYDDDGIAMEYSGAKGKRKRDDDGAFRPKGGKSAHPAKRRKEDGGGSTKKKRPSLDARIS